MMTAERLTKDAINRRYFREAYGTGTHGWAVTGASPRVLEYLRRARELRPDGCLLDLGCGEGRHCLTAARLGFAVIGVDFEPLALERARQLLPAEWLPRIDLRAGDALNLPLPDACADVALDYGCLHHQRKADWPRYRASLLRVLKPRGCYLLAAFSPNFRLFQGSKRHWHLAYGAYRRCFTREELIALWEKDFTFLDLVEEHNEREGMWYAMMQRR